MLLLKIRPPLAVIVKFPLETRALSRFIVEPLEVRTKFPAEEVLLALRVSASVALKVIPSFNVNTEEFALIFKLPDDVETPPFKLIPEFAVKATAPAAFKLPVMVMLVGAVKVKSAAATIPPVIALKTMDDALVKVAPLAKLILSLGSMESIALSVSPFKLRAPIVVTISTLASRVIPFIAFASSEEKEESA